MHVQSLVKKLFIALRLVVDVKATFSEYKRPTYRLQTVQFSKSIFLCLSKSHDFQNEISMWVAMRLVLPVALEVLPASSTSLNSSERLLFYRMSLIAL